MKDKHINNLRISYLFLFLLVCCESYFSQHYRKCKLFKGHQAKQISQFNEQRIPIVTTNFYIEPLIETRMPLVYINKDYLYHEYVGAGGSGQVYIVEDLETSKPIIIKRFFKQNSVEFEEENFIMHRMNYSIQWTRDYQNGIPTHTDYQESSPASPPSIAIYPFKQSLTLRDVQFHPQQAPLIFYKILLELQKTHKSSLIHNDLKMGNIMINSLGHDFKFFQAQLIDWNLATYYYHGREGNTRKGTVCYYSPEQLMRANHYTPAIDVWALAVVMWTFVNDEKPFFADCKQGNLKAIATLVGVQRIVQMRNKYRFSVVDQFYQLLEDYAVNPGQYKPRDLRRLIKEDKKEFFTDDLIDVFKRMLNPDPEQRITVTQLLNHNYFGQLKKIPTMFTEKIKANQKKKKPQSKKKM